MTMRILADGVAFINTEQRGIQRYGRELFSRVAKQYPVDLVLSGYPQCELPAGCNPKFCRERFTSYRANLPMRAWRKFRRRFAPTRFPGHTLFHTLFFQSSPEPRLPVVLTLHDMIPETFPNFYADTTHNEHKLSAMEQATKIICISHATAADVGRIYPHLKSKLSIVHHGADHLAGPGALDLGSGRPAVASAESPYVIFVGERSLYKNFATMIAAVGDPIWPKDVGLIVVGPKAKADEIENVRRRGLASKIHFKGFVSDKDLKAYYRQSLGFVFPSLGEGFGFPQLEAQSMRVPVLCSDLPVFREVSADSAMYFDPLNPTSIAQAVVDLLNADPRVLVQRGLENVKRFRWDTCAAQTIDVYRAAVN